MASRWNEVTSGKTTTITIDATSKPANARRRSSAQLLSAYGARRMSDAFTASGVRASFPPVTIDKSLHDFLREELGDGEQNQSHCYVKAHSEPAFGELAPMSRKFLIHCAQVGNPEDLAHLQLEMCNFLLGFFLGPVKLIFIGCEGNSQDKSLHAQAIYRNAVQSFTVLHETQRPQVLCYGNKDDFWVNHDGSDVRFAFGMDIAERVPCVFSPELTYLLNSKRWLVEALRQSPDLETPNDKLIDTEIKCEKHHTEAGFWYNGGKGCDTCTHGIPDEVDRVLEVLDSRPLPYVLKLTQSLSSVGTHIVTTEDVRTEVKNKIRRTLLDYLPRITRENAHLYTMTLIMSDLIPGRTMALNFFVRKNGDCVFSGACHQLATGLTGRQNTAITYPDQEVLEKKYVGTLGKFSKLLAEAGYYGQCGVDVMEDEKTGTQYIIDANVRTALSMMLYQLKGHFTSHGHKMAMVYECLFLGVDREELEERFAQEFEEAKIVILGSMKLGKKPVWGYGVVIAGEDKRELDDISDRMLRLETKAHTVPQE